MGKGCSLHSERRLHCTASSLGAGQGKESASLGAELAGAWWPLSQGDFAAGSAVIKLKQVFIHKLYPAEPATCNWVTAESFIGYMVTDVTDF